MKTNVSFIVILFIVVLSCSSCVHYYYAPNSNNVPLFKEKNEARIQVQYTGIEYGPSLTVDGFEIQSAYAVGKQTAVQLNFFHAEGEEESYGSGYGNYIEAAGGYFKPSANRPLVFETYAGVGIGTVTSVYETDLSKEVAKTSITKFFLQPSLGYTRNHFDVALSSKFAIVNTGLRSSSVTTENHPEDFDYLESFKHGKPVFC